MFGKLSTRERMSKTMHYLLAHYSALADISREEAKDELKDWLRINKMIKTSTKELDLKGLAIALNTIEKWIKIRS